MLRLGIAPGYILVVAVLVAAAVASGSGETAAFGFVAFGIASLAFGYAFIRRSEGQAVDSRSGLALASRQSERPDEGSAAWPASRTR